MLQVPPGTHPPKTRTFAKDEVLGEIYEFLADQEECFGLRDPQLRRLLAELGGPHPADDWTDDEKRGIYLDMLRDFARNGPQLPTDILRGLSAKPHATNWRMIRPNQVKYAYFDIISAVAAIYCAEQYDPAGAECVTARLRQSLAPSLWSREVLPRLRALGVQPREGRPRRLAPRGAQGYWRLAEAACQEALTATRRSLGRAADAAEGMAPAPTEAEVARRWADANRRALARAEGRSRRVGRSRTARAADLDRAAERIFSVLQA